MIPHASIGILLLLLAAGGRGPGAEPPNCEPARPCFLEQVAPAGGWFPYGGGLLHWWDPHCFPRGGCPDDYCRKPLPFVCWPSCLPCGAPHPSAVVGTIPDGKDRVSPP